MADDRWKTWTPWRLKRAQAAEAATAEVDGNRLEPADENRLQEKGKQHGSDRTVPEE